ncbi:MAG: hypothetical protein CR993_07180 [Rhodobacterales bacterium]|nr:MAG: hypothetical protein CR993_07180 [Rhodobacterales bacterium]
MRRAVAALLTVLSLSACERGLTANETAMARGLFGDTLNVEAVRVHAGWGLLPLPRPKPVPEGGPQVRAAPKGLCDRKRSTRRVWRWPAAFVLYNDVFFNHDYYRPDTFAGFPNSAPFPASVIMAHELVHVWQWQNAALTGYSVSESAGETVKHIDPYWFETARGSEFLSYGFEQQGAMVQDFTCYALFDPKNPKVEELAAILRPVLPVDGFLKLTRAR